MRRDPHFLDWLTPEDEAAVLGLLDQAVAPVTVVPPHATRRRWWRHPDVRRAIEHVGRVALLGLLAVVLAVIMSWRG